MTSLPPPATPVDPDAMTVVVPDARPSTRRPTRGRLVAVVVGVGFVVFALLFGFTVVSTQEQAQTQQGFDPEGYVAGIWDDVRVAITDDAVPLADVLTRIVPDADGKASTEDLVPVAQELGLITTGEAEVFRVTGTGTVTATAARRRPGTSPSHDPR